MRSEWALIGVLPFLMLVHALPHLPGDHAEPVDSYVELGARAVDGITGDDYPYPVHADEHIHQAWMAQVVRQETADIDDPQVGGKETQDLFTVSGMRSERGWNVAVVQFSLLTDLPLLAVARFLPAIWAAFLGLTVWAALRPAPGAVTAAALVALLPTTLRFLGVGFLVPSAFALPWVFVTLLVASKIDGAQRFFGLLLLITAGHFMHLVLGVMCILAAVAGTLVRGERPMQRASMLVVALVPLVWILPTTLRDAESAVGSEHTLPFAEQIFQHAGPAIYALGAIGAALAFLRPDTANRPHRAMALMAIPLTLSLFLSVRYDHRNDATYSRIIFVYFLCFTGLTSYALGEGARRIAAWRPRLRPWQGPAIIAAALLLLPTGLANSLNETYYRIHDDDSWEAAQILDGLPLSADDVILSEPDQGPLFSAVTGARLAVPFSPGGGPANSDWSHYQRSGGADAEWLQQRGITYVIGLAPNAPHDALGGNVYRLRIPETNENRT